MVQTSIVQKNAYMYHLDAKVWVKLIKASKCQKHSVFSWMSEAINIWNDTSIIPMASFLSFGKLAFAELSSSFVIHLLIPPIFCKVFRAHYGWTLPKKCPYSELFWSAFFRIWTQYREILSISSYSVRMRENVDWNNTEYRHSSRNGTFLFALVQLLAAYIAQFRNFYKEQTYMRIKTW